MQKDTPNASGPMDAFVSVFENIKRKMTPEKEADNASNEPKSKKNDE